MLGLWTQRLPDLFIVLTETSAVSSFIKLPWTPEKGNRHQRRAGALTLSWLRVTIIPVVGSPIKSSLVSCFLSNHHPRTTNHEPRSTNHEPQTTNHEPRSTIQATTSCFTSTIRSYQLRNNPTADRHFQAERKSLMTMPSASPNHRTSRR